MADQGIIVPVGDGESYWVSSLVIREKSDSRLCICLDWRISTRSSREHHLVATVDDITPRLCGATQLSKLDTAQGNWNASLAKQLQTLTTFNTQKGRYKFFRIPFGLKMSQDIFHRMIDQTYNCQSTLGIADDVQAFGDDSDHDLHLYGVIENQIGRYQIKFW